MCNVTTKDALGNCDVMLFKVDNRHNVYFLRHKGVML
ncbi:Uncharacterised protein [Staphylococcus microti]|uniref:Uncharacterized protein n=1 Tax=Staphylococcus microti TaxID=569857 RepID=A0A380GUY5_9STAP|nr:Uncharacterised protein [Staphylococcus microti]